MNKDILITIRDNILKYKQADTSKYTLIESRLNETIDAYINSLNASESYILNHDGFKALKSYDREVSHEQIN